MDIVSSVRGLFPEVIAEVEQYRRTKDDRDARNLARRLANEEALYDQFMRKLSLLPSVSSTNSRDALLRNVENKFGSKTADDLKSELHLMEDYLRGLKPDLANTSRGTEVLAKFRRTTSLARAVLPKNPLQKRLDDLSRVNKRLTAYLLQSPTPVAFVREPHAALDFELWLQKQGEEPSSAALRIANDRHLCAFQETVAKDTTQGDCRSFSFDKDVPPSCWDCKEDLTSLYQKSGHISIQSFKHQYESSGLVQDGCCIVEEPASKQRSPRQDNNKKTFRVAIKDTTLPSAATNFGDLILQHSTKFDSRRRMELAFRLSSAVLLAYTSPLIPNSSKWKDWVVSFDLDQDDLCHLYISPDLHAEEQEISGNVDEMNAWKSIGREPILTLLGMRLTELAFGRTLAELRRETDGLLHRESEEESENDDDRKMLDLMTAKRLLALHRIGDESGQNFEDVVNVCLNQQYRQQKGACITELKLQEKSFLEHAAVAILLPLYEEAHRYSGCACKGNDLNATGQKTIETKAPQLENQKDANIPLVSATAQETAEKTVHIPESVAKTDAFYISSDPPQHLSTALFWSPNNASAEIVNVQPASEIDKQRSIWRETPAETKSSLIEPKPEVEKTSSRQLPRLDDSQLGEEKSGEMLHPHQQDTDAATVCSYETMAGTTDSAFPWLSDHSDEPPDIPDNHPLLSMKGIALRVLLIAYRAWRERGNTSNEPAGSTARAESSKKRNRMEPEKGQDDEDEKDEEESPHRNPGVLHKKRRVKEESRTFACPFFKKDAVTHGRCCAYTLTRISDVKQHLVRRHNMPIYCPRCIKTFNNEDERDTHVRDADCRRAPHGKPEGITEHQRRQLGKKAPPNQMPEQQWYGVFDLLFPGHEPRPQSPYIDSGLLQNVLEFHSFSISSGPRILSDILIARGWRPPADGVDEQAFQRRVLEEGFQAIFDEWTSLGGLQASDSNTIDSSTREINQNITSASQGPTSDYHVEEQYSAPTSSNFTASSSTFETSSESFDGERELMARLDLSSWGHPFDNEADFQRRLYTEMGLQDPEMDYN